MCFVDFRLTDSFVWQAGIRSLFVTNGIHAEELTALRDDARTSAKQSTVSVDDQALGAVFDRYEVRASHTIPTFVW